MAGIGERIKSIRNDANLDQLEFSKIFEVSRQTVSNWETDKQEVKIDVLIRIAGIGKKSLDWLITGIDPSEKYKQEIAKKDVAIDELLEKFGQLRDSVSKDINNPKTKRVS